MTGTVAADLPAEPKASVALDESPAARPARPVAPASGSVGRHRPPVLRVECGEEDAVEDDEVGSDDDARLVKRLFASPRRRTPGTIGRVMQALFEASGHLVEAPDDYKDSGRLPSLSSDVRGMQYDLADGFRHAGNRLFHMGRFDDAAERYSEGLAAKPRDYRLWCCRAACRAAQKEWSKCWGDAQHAIQLEPGYVKGWLLVSKALWRDNMPVMAKQVLAEGLRLMPGCPALLAMNAEIDRCRSRPSSPMAAALRGEVRRPHAPCGFLHDVETPPRRSTAKGDAAVRMAAAIERLVAPSPLDTPAGGSAGDSTRCTTPGSGSSRSSPCTAIAAALEPLPSGRCFPRPGRAPRVPLPEAIRTLMPALNFVAGAPAAPPSTPPAAAGPPPRSLLCSGSFIRGGGASDKCASVGPQEQSAVSAACRRCGILSSFECRGGRDDARVAPIATGRGPCDTSPPTPTPQHPRQTCRGMMAVLAPLSAADCFLPQRMIWLGTQRICSASADALGAHKLSPPSRLNGTEATPTAAVMT